MLHSHDGRGHFVNGAGKNKPSHETDSQQNETSMMITKNGIKYI